MTRRPPFAGIAILAAMILMMIGPILTVLIWAFAVKWRYPHLLPTESGLKYWGVMLGRSTVIEPILTSLAITSLFTSLAALICWPAAYGLARLSFPGRQLLLFTFIAAQAVPKFALFVFIAVVFLQLGLVGTVWGVVLVQMLSAMLYMIWVPTAAFRGIPPLPEEAGFDLGAKAALFVIAHPMSPGDPACTGCRWEYPDMRPGPAQIVEVWNGGPWSDFNQDGLQLFQQWLSAGHHLVATAGWDIHGPDGWSGPCRFNHVQADDLDRFGVAQVHQIKATLPGP